MQAPEKPKTRGHPAIEDDPWMVIHGSIRDDFKTIAAALEPAEISAARKVALKEFLGLHSELVESHHHHEEDIFFPELVKRGVDLPPKLSADHAVLEKLLAEFVKATDALTATDSDGKTDDAKAAFEEYSTKMLKHLKEEEDTALLLYRANVTAEENDAIVASFAPELPWWMWGWMLRHRFPTDEAKKDYLLTNLGMPPPVVEGVAETFPQFTEKMTPVWEGLSA